MSKNLSNQLVPHNWWQCLIKIIPLHIPLKTCRSKTLPIPLICYRCLSIAKPVLAAGRPIKKLILHCMQKHHLLELLKTGLQEKKSLIYLRGNRKILRLSLEEPDEERLNLFIERLLGCSFKRKSTSYNFSNFIPISII